MPKNQQFWAPEEEDLLKRTYPRLGYRVVGLFPSRTKVSVVRKAEALGLQVDPDLQRKAIDQFNEEVKGGLTRHRFEVETDAPIVNVVLFGDLHIGAPNNTCNLVYAKKMLQKIREDSVRDVGDTRGCPTYLLGMGDYGDFAQKAHEGGPSVYSQTLDNQAQIETVTELLRPLAEKGKIIGLHGGNHDAYVLDNSGVDIIRNLCRELDVPHLGSGCYTMIQVNEAEYVFYTFHGKGAARTSASKLLTLLNATVGKTADVYAMGHVHSLANTPGINDIHGELKKCYYVLSGGYLEWDGSYAQRYGLRAEKTGSPWIHLNAQRWDMHVVT